jgi:hypothetical protein
LTRQRYNDTQIQFSGGLFNPLNFFVNLLAFSVPVWHSGDAFIIIGFASKWDTLWGGWVVFSAIGLARQHFFYPLLSESPRLFVPADL